MKEQHKRVIAEYEKCFDHLVMKFFDPDSEKNLDVKLEVLQRLNKGTPPGDIEEYYDILENYPTEEMWD